MVKKTLILLLILGISMGFVGSCSKHLSTPTEFEELKPTKNLKNATKNVEDVSKKIGEGAKKIDTNAESIKESAKEIDKSVPDNVKITVKPHTANIIKKSDAIITEATKIASLQSQLGQALSDLEIATDKMGKMEEQIITSIQERYKAFAERDKILEKLKESEARESEATAKLLRWLILACVIAAGASIALMVFRSFAFGAALLIGSIATLILAITINAYFEWIALGGLVVLALVVVAIGFQLWRKQKNLNEVVTTTEIVKDKLNDKERKELFGQGADPGRISTIQSTSTENVVNKIRRKMAKKWNPTVDK